VLIDEACKPKRLLTKEVCEVKETREVIKQDFREVEQKRSYHSPRRSPPRREPRRSPSKDRDNYFEDPRSNRYNSNPNKGPYTYIHVPNELTGVVIGKRGETVRYLQDKYDVDIFIPRTVLKDAKCNRLIELSGNSDYYIRKAKNAIERIVE
jgi:hypothetical protein